MELELYKREVSTWKEGKIRDVSFQTSQVLPLGDSFGMVVSFVGY